MPLDILYVIGLAVVWIGNFDQIRKIYRTKSTKSISLPWVMAIFLSISIRLPRAWTSTYWVWQYGYVISFVICAGLLSVIIYYRRRYPGK